jgi:hypothetical protein
MRLGAPLESIIVLSQDLALDSELVVPLSLASSVTARFLFFGDGAFDNFAFSCGSCATGLATEGGVSTFMGSGALGFLVGVGTVFFFVEVASFFWNLINVCFCFEFFLTVLFCSLVS